MSRNNSQTNNGNGSYLPAFIPPPPPANPIHFTWLVNYIGDNGEDVMMEKTYTPSSLGVLTYHIPRIHVSVDEDFIKNVLRDYFTRNLGAESTIAQVGRIDFRPIEGNPDFRSAFVYHYDFTHATGDWTGHFYAIAQRGAGVWSNSAAYPENMPLASRITKSIFMGEYSNQPVKVHFTHNGRQNFWMLLPNRNPLTENQRVMMENTAESMAQLVEGLLLLADDDLPVPNDFDSSVLFDDKIDTAWTPEYEATPKIFGKWNRVTMERDRIRAYADEHGALAFRDLEAMEDFEEEMEDFDCAIEMLQEEAERPHWPPPLTTAAAHQ